jgi:hypothetical protein
VPEQVFSKFLQCFPSNHHSIIAPCSHNLHVRPYQASHYHIFSIYIWPKCWVLTEWAS